MGRNRSMYDWNWLKANDAFKRCRKKYNGALVAKHSYIKECGRDEGGEAIYAGTYCGTTLVKWYPNGRIEVSSHGWNTMTTKRRLYQYARVSMDRIKGNDILRDTTGQTRTAVVDNGQWFTLRDDEGEWGLREVGQPIVRGTIHPMRRPSEAKRNPLKKLCRGDVLISPEGKPFLCSGRRGGGVKVMDLVPYFGDPASGLSRMEWEGHIEVTDLMQLTLPVSGWTAGKRFNSAA
jgi:hypothetical protein